MRRLAATIFGTILASSAFAQDGPVGPPKPGEWWGNRHPVELLKIPGVLAYGSSPLAEEAPAPLLVIVEDEKVAERLPKYLSTPVRYPAEMGPDLQWKIEVVKATDPRNAFRSDPGPETMVWILNAKDAEAEKRIPARINGGVVRSRVPREINENPVRVLVADPGVLPSKAAPRGLAAPDARDVVGSLFDGSPRRIVDRALSRLWEDLPADRRAYLQERLSGIDRKLREIETKYGIRKR